MREIIRESNKVRNDKIWSSFLSHILILSFVQEWKTTEAFPAYKFPKQTYLIEEYSSMPYFDPSRPIP